jgi:hypothetical protein
MPCFIREKACGSYMIAAFAGRSVGGTEALECGKLDGPQAA